MLAALVACSAEPAHYDARDACAPLAIAPVAATALESDGIADGIALWRDRGASAFDPAAGDAAPAPADAAPAIAIRFDDAAAAFHGVYDPASATIAINRSITDRTAIAIVVAHELGHVFGLVHIAPATRISLMNPGNLVTPPTDGDERALEALWGTCQ